MRSRTSSKADAEPKSGIPSGQSLASQFCAKVRVRAFLEETASYCASDDVDDKCWRDHHHRQRSEYGWMGWILSGEYCTLTANVELEQNR